MALSLDGTGPTGAWSMYRDLLTSFVGGTRYTTATGVNLLTDQSGNARNFTQATGSAQPVVTTAGPNSKTCADFDGSNDLMGTSANLGTFITNTTGYIVVSFIADAITANDASAVLNNSVIGDSGDILGLLLKNTGTPASLLAYHFDTNADVATAAAAITVGTHYVVEWRHEASVLYLRVNGGTEVSTASLVTSSLGNVLRLARLSNAAPLGNIKVFEAATFSTIPALATRDAIVANWLAQSDAPAGGSVKVWTGSAWECKPIKAWSGSAWVGKPIRAWTGSAWVETTCADEAIILDDVVPTGAWSMSRDLLTSFVGGSRYTDVSGAVSVLTDQSGNARNLTQGTAANRPAVTTAGPNSRACMDFDGSNDFVTGGLGSADLFVAASSGYMVVSFIADAITINNATVYNNHEIIGETGGYLGLFLKNTDATAGNPDSIIAYNYDGSIDVATSVAIVVGTPYVAEWKHTGGQVSVRVNGGTWVDTASGNTSVGYGGFNFQLGAGDAGGKPFNGKIFEAVTFSTIPDDTKKAAIVADFMTHIGA